MKRLTMLAALAAAVGLASCQAPTWARSGSSQSSSRVWGSSAWGSSSSRSGSSYVGSSSQTTAGSAATSYLKGKG